MGDVLVSERIRSIDNSLQKLKKVAEQGMQSSDYEKVLAAITAYCNIQYSINQIYTDKKSEEYNIY